MSQPLLVLSPVLSVQVQLGITMRILICRSTFNSVISLVFNVPCFEISAILIIPTDLCILSTTHDSRLTIPNYELYTTL